MKRGACVFTFLSVFTLLVLRGVGGVVCLLTTLLLLLSSYGSGGGLISPVPHPMLGISSIHPSDSSMITQLFSPSASRLGGFSIGQGERGARITSPIVAHSTPSVMTQKAHVADSTIDMSSICPNVSQIGGCRFARHSIPSTFSNFHVTFVSSLRCGDLFGRGKLRDLIHLLGTRRTSMLLVKNSCRRKYRCIPRLFTTLTGIGAPVKACKIVKGGSCRHYRSRVVHRVRHCNVQPLRRRVSALEHSKTRVVLTNMHGPFSLTGGKISPALSLSSSSFMVLLMRAPSCTRSISITGSSLILTKRARNKRIQVLKCTPVVPSRCNDHFLAKLGCGSTGVPVVIAGKVNASGGGVHVNTPTRVIVVALRHLQGRWFSNVTKIKEVGTSNLLCGSFVCDQVGRVACVFSNDRNFSSRNEASFRCKEVYCICIQKWL